MSYDGEAKSAAAIACSPARPPAIPCKPFSPLHIMDFGPGFRRAPIGVTCSILNRSRFEVHAILKHEVT